MRQDHKTVIVIGGPTAAGKTALAIQIAQKFQAEIISADSRQCYKEMNIGVARPSSAELSLVKHHFIASYSIKDRVSASVFEHFAISKANALFEKDSVVVMVGGTGLYIKAFCEGLDEIPPLPAGIRDLIVEEYTKNGLDWLRDEVARLDPMYYASGETMNPHRMIRALEVMKGTGRSINEFKKGNPKQRSFNIIKLGVEVPKHQLHFQIRKRVQNMLDAGLVDEVRSLIPFKDLEALNTVGYKEIFEYLDAKFSLEKAVELIDQHTRQCAKRQMTWFKKDREIQWFSPNAQEIIQHLEHSLR